MKRIAEVLGSAGILAATTLGAGIFALPYVFYRAGWVTSLFYMLVFGAALIFIHTLYARVLFRERGAKRLLGLVQTHFGERAFWFAFVALVGGLLLVLVIYLALVHTSVGLIFPSVDPRIGLFVFWATASLPLFLRLRWLVRLEFLGTALMAGVILFIFLTPAHVPAAPRIPAIDLTNIFLPFGPILFALAGWTAIEPMYEYAKKQNGGEATTKAALAWGTAFVALLYGFFVLAIFRSASIITPDTVSGLADWDSAQVAFLGALGIFAIWTSYVPVALEVQSALSHDMRLPKFLASSAVVFLPPIFYILGLRNFLSLLGIAGGVFLGLQYICIILVSKRSLRLGRGAKILLNALVIMFLLAAAYEVYYFLK